MANHDSNDTPRPFSASQVTRLALLSLLICGLFVTAATARAGDRPGFLPPAGYLDLDEAQAAQTEAIVSQLMADSQPLRQESRRLLGFLGEILDGDSPDAAAAGELVIAVHGIREQIRELRSAASTEFEALLDREQLVKWQNFQELRFLTRHPRAGLFSPEEG